MLGLGLSLQKGISAFNAGRALVSSYIRRVTEAGGVLQNTACDAAAINELNQDRLLEPASWVLVPDGIEEDVVFAQKPTSGLGDLTFTRASDATYTDAGGVVRRSPYNLVTSSSDFSQSYSLINSTITTNTITDPFGTLLGDSQLETIATDVHAGYNDYTVLVGSQYTFSVYVKSIGGRDVRVSGSSGIDGPVAVVNLSNGAILSSSGTIQVTNAGNGWYRISITATATTTTARILIYSMVGTQTTFAGDVTKGVYLFGRQLVEGTEALDYFPTTNRQDVPRIDFRNADGTLSSCGRLLLEPQRTNVALQSESLNTNPNVADASTFTANVYISPSGTQSADQLTETTANDKHGFYQYTTVTAQAYTASVFTKQTGRRYISFTSDVTGTQVSSFFDLQTKSVLTSASGHTCSVQDYGDGWLRLIVSFTASAGNRFLIWGGSINGTNNTYAGSTSVSQTFWGYQLEAGTYPTTYIPTTTAAVTRIGDSTFKAGLSSLFGTEGTWFIEMSPSSVGVSTTAFKKVIGLYQVNGSIADCIYLEEYNGNWGVFVRKANTTVVSRTYGTQPRKLAVTFGATGSRIYIDGVQAASTASNTSISPVQISAREATGSAIETVLNVSQMAYFPTPLTQDQLEVLTSEGYGTYALLAQSLNCVLQ